MKLLSKYFILLGIGGLIYVMMELIWRGHSHWSMFVVGGVCFIFLGLINEIIPWNMPLYQQVLIGVLIITFLEFIAGCIVNIWLGWQVWDYSHLPGNIMGQICPLFCCLWVPVSLIGIVLDDWLRYWLFREKRPCYKLI